MPKRSLLLVFCFVLTACARPEVVQGIYDPNEDRNRKVHAFNKKVDSAILRPVAVGYSAAMPDGIEENINNFADTADIPGDVLNQILQGDLNAATRNTVRFAINATLGFGGLADVATDLGLPEDDTDFGETLHVWGAGEGPYVERPIFGPSTRRDAVGSLVDRLLNPMRLIVSPESGRIVTAAGVAETLSDRGRFAGTVDSILYDSADSYAQTRLFYLQNRRFELGIETQDDYIDPEEIDTSGF